MYVEPSFKIIEDASYEIRNIHTVRKLKSSHNRLVATYTCGYEVYETLAAIIFCLLRYLPNGCTYIELQEEQSGIMDDTLEIVNLLLAWDEYTLKVQKLEQTIAEIDARAARYDEDVRRADQETKWAKQDFKNAQEQDGYGWYAQRVNEAVAERRLIATNRRCDPKRKLKAQAQLSQLEAEIRRLRPTFRKHVRPELRELI